MQQQLMKTQIVDANIYRNLFTRRRVIGLRLFCVLVLSVFSQIAIAQTATIFEKPPSTDELAEILFPPKTRSIVINEEFSDSAGPAPSAGIAGMLIQFKFGKTDIEPSSLRFLDALGELLSEDAFMNESIIIEGHTDAVGGLAFNQQLSERRALAVRRYLVSRFKIDIARLHPVGKGETMLHEPGNPKASINRRVQFRALERSQ
jgi:outer membrane protein OmpA-like peptidoglycan-associated protein